MEIQKRGGVGSDGRLELDAKNCFKLFKSPEELRSEELNALRRRANSNREEARRLPDYLATASRSREDFVDDYKRSVAGGPRGQATVNFEEAEDAAGFAALASGHGSTVALAIQGLPDEERAIDDSIRVGDLTSVGAKLLAVDRAKLPPLEHFEHSDFTDKDRPPAEWLAGGPTGAAVPYWSNGEWTWAACEVVTYDDEDKKFEVRIKGDPGGNKKKAAAALGTKPPKAGEDGDVKRVRRLNCRFDAEDAFMFEQRRRAAQEGREQVITSLRFDEMVTQRAIPPGVASLVPEQRMVDSIHNFVFDPLPAGFKHELTLGGSGASAAEDDEASLEAGPNPFWRGRLGEHLGDGVRSFARGIRLGVLRRDLQRSEALREEIRSSGLPLPPAKEPAPVFGKVDIGPRLVPYEHILAAVASGHFCAKREVTFALSWLHRDWELNQAQHRFVDTSAGFLGAKPWPLGRFVEAQTAFCGATAEALQDKWRTAFAETVTDCGQTVFDLFVNDIEVLCASPLMTFLTHVRLRMALLLRSLVEATAAELESMVSAHTMPLEGGEGAELGCRVRGSGDGGHATPLLVAAVAVSVEEGAVVEPSRGEAEAALLELVDQMVAAARGIAAIDPRVASMVALEERPLLEVERRGDPHPLCSGLDERLKGLRRLVSAAVARAYEGPDSVAERFSEYVWVLEIETPEYVEHFCSAVPPPSHEALSEKIRTFHRLSVEVGGSHVAFDDEEFSLLRVGTVKAKADIVDKAVEVRDALLARMVEDLTAKNDFIVETYEDMLETLAHVPANEEELASLRDFIAAAPPRVAELVSDVTTVHEQLALVEEFGYRVGEEEGLLAWSTMTFPLQVKDAIESAQATQEARQARLLDELAAEKEAFDKLLEKYGADLGRCKLFGDYDAWEESAGSVNELFDGLQAAKKKVLDFNKREAVFKFPPTEYPVIDSIEKELEPCFKLWNMIAEFNTNQKEWMSGSFLAIDAPKVETDVVDWFKSSAKMAKLLESEYPRAAECATRLREVTGDFRKHLPVMVALATPALKQRHWDQLSVMLGREEMIEPSEDLTLEDLLTWGVADHIEEIEEISVHANKQFGLEKQLAAMKADWAPMEFEVKEYRTTGTCIIGGLDDIVAMLDEHIVKTQTMRGSPFVKGIREECEGWQHQLMYGQDMLDEWIKVQRTWMYLQPIFDSEDIMRQLPTEARRFNDVDKIWRKILAEAKENPGFLSLAAEDKGYKQKFASANEKLDRVQKGLNDYLEVKRKYFPRFFFLSNDELLEILSQTKDPQAVQPHLGKAFEGIAKVRFEKDLKISEMHAAKGEVVVLDEPVDPEKGKNKGNVECWLLELEHMQWRTLKTQTELCLDDYRASPRSDWTLKWPQQCILGGSSVYWTIEVNDVIAAGGSVGLREYIDKTLNPQLLDIVMLVRGKLNKVQMSTLGALVVIDVHARDTIVMMADAKVRPRFLTG